jgi:small-conductance mechanosensitive channel
VTVNHYILITIGLQHLLSTFLFLPHSFHYFSSSLFHQIFPELTSKVKILNIETSFETLLFSALVIIIGIVIARVVKTVLNRALREKIPKGSRVLMERIAFYFIVFLAGLAAMSNLGVDFTGALLAGGFFGIIIGFATQSVVSNLLSGVFLHLDRPLEIGEPVEIEDMNIAGVVTDITAFSTRLRKFDGTFIRVPNDKLFTSRIKNFNRYPARRIDFKIRISYQQDVGQAIDLIKSRLDANPLILVEPVPDVFVDSINEYSLDLSIFAWTAKDAAFEVKKKIIEDIKFYMDDAKIEIPFPQRVVHFVGDVDKFSQYFNSLIPDNTKKIEENEVVNKDSQIGEDE